MKTDKQHQKSIIERWESDRIPTSSCSQCNFCKNLLKDDTCTAFPNGIPKEIIRNVFIHNKPYMGDNGIMYEPCSPKYADVRFKSFDEKQEF